MKTYSFFLLLCLVCFVISCKQQKHTEALTDTKTIPFEYDDDFLKLIIFSSTLNDSIPVNVVFDTGVGGQKIILSDSIAELLADTVVNLQIGAYQSSVPVFVLNRKNFMFKQFDAIIGWNFFKDKIIEISYQHKYIRELDSIPTSSDFFPINMGTRLLIPVKVNIQGKCIEDNLLLDTGNNNYVSLGKYYVDKYSIDLTTDAPLKFAMTVGGASPNISLPGGAVSSDTEQVTSSFALVRAVAMPPPA